jgi:hypothetical protein
MVIRLDQALIEQHLGLQRLAALRQRVGALRKNFEGRFGAFAHGRGLARFGWRMG